MKRLALFTLTSILGLSSAPETQAIGARPHNYSVPILAIAQNSACRTYKWKNRGTAKPAYVTGMALTFAKSLCRLRSKDNVALLMSQKAEGDMKRDALYHYQREFSQLKVETDREGAETLKALYTLGMGLGMRESSGRYCEGWDTNAGSNRESKSAEAGLFQTSFNSVDAAPQLRELFNEYSSGRSPCYLGAFAPGVECKERSILGSGEGARFQQLARSCPAFATEYAMITLRVLRQHYGPINRKTAEINPQCYNMFDQVEEYVSKRAGQICTDILKHEVVPYDGPVFKMKPRLSVNSESIQQSSGIEWLQEQ